MTCGARQVLLLIRPTLRSTSWLLPAGACALVLAAHAAAGRLAPMQGLELGALALAVSFALDDPAADSLAATPVPLGLRHALRAACVVPLAATTWLVLALGSAAPGSRTVELAGLLAFVLAIAAVGIRLGESGGLVAAPALLGVIGAMGLLPAHHSPLAAEATGGAAFVARWALVLALAGAVGAAASREPEGRGWRTPSGGPPRRRRSA